MSRLYIIILCVMLVLPVQVNAKKKHVIRSVEQVAVEVMESCVPHLPYLLYVTYDDGKHEWRQVRWSNSDVEEERRMADAKLYPAGSTYDIKGFVIGDDTTDEGFPVIATVKVVAPRMDTVLGLGAVSPTPVAATLPLSDVRLTGDNRLTSNRDLDIRTLLALDITQQLYNYRDTYGLPTEGYTESDGWDSPTTKLKGHGTGHYMSALAFAFASAQDKEQKLELYKRIERMVRELRQCQERTFVWSDSLGRYFEARDYAPEAQLQEMKGDWNAFEQYKKDYQHYGYGYLNAIPAAHPALIECYRAYNNEEWVWAPYYTIHKQLAGLIDIANVMLNVELPSNVLRDLNATPKGLMSQKEVGTMALLIAQDMGLWVWNRLHYRTYVKTDGSKAERQARPGNRYEMWNMYIAGEVGGMSESLARLSEMTKDQTKKARLLEASNYFDAPAFFEPLSRNIDDIRNRHANQHIPMITGALRSFRGNGNPYYYNIAQNFWNLVQGRYTYATGGVGNAEMFREPYTQTLSMNNNTTKDGNGNDVPNPSLNETCCAYNLAKLTKDLNCYSPDDARYMDYYERVLYNQIVGSVNAKKWGVCYHYAVGMNADKDFGSTAPHHTCCGGTGAENHLKYQEAAYFVTDNTLYVGLYLPTEANWRAKGVTVTQQCEWPAERSVIKVSGGRFAMKLRVPYWATEKFDVKLNGKSISKRYMPSSYVEIGEREWMESDVVEVIMPFSSHIFYGADKMENDWWVGALMYGPLVMATNEMQTWNDAECTLNANLSDIEPLGHTIDHGVDGNLYTLRFAGKTFYPDYYLTKNITHYLRLDIKSHKTKKVPK